MENVKISPYKFPKIKKIYFWSFSGCCMGIICLHTPTKSSLAVILRGQPSFCDHWFTRYGFSDFSSLPGLFLANQPWPKIRHLFFLTLLESKNQFLKRKWIYMEVYMGSNSAPAVGLATSSCFLLSFFLFSFSIQFCISVQFWFLHL